MCLFIYSKKKPILIDVNMKYLRPFAALSLAALPVAVHKRQFHANRIFMPVRYESEFDNIALLPTPLLANFTLRGHSQSDQLTGAIIKILSYETEKSISAVDIETDEATTRPIMERYGVSFFLFFIRMIQSDCVLFERN